METEAGGPVSRSKKRKQAPLEPAGEDERATEDRISQIPDAVLGEVVSLLPTKEGARTQILASRWRHIWRSAPLNLDCEGIPSNSADLDHAVSRILAAHPGPVRRLCLPAGHGSVDDTVEALLQSPALDNLQELDLGYIRMKYCGSIRVTSSLPAPLFPPPPLPPPPPSSTFRFAATLCLVSLRKCHLTDGTVQALHLPQLKHLALIEVIISDYALHSLIARCPVLECLLLQYIKFCCVRINSFTLRRIGVRFGGFWMGEHRSEKLIIENAPCLERLLCLDLLEGLQVSMISAPNLKILGFFTSYHPCFYRFIKKGLRADSLTTVAHLVKTLAIHVPVLDLDAVIDLMRCFPLLEKLYIQNESIRVSGSRPNNFWRRKHRNLIGCLDIHLKTIVFETYRGIVSEVNFATFFVLNARELDSMTIQVETVDEEFIAKQQRLLQLENKASTGARFHFTTDRCLRDIGDICHVRDLDLTDPFVR